MKTALVTTCYLNDKEYLQKTVKWINYYAALNKLEYDIIYLLDNASDPQNIELLKANIFKHVYIHSFKEHLPRSAHLEYPYLWRAVDYLKYLLEGGYDKVIYMDNDFYLLSEKAIDYVNKVKSGWISFYCNKHKFPETGIQIITKDNENYKNFLKTGDLMSYNGKMMETTLPLSEVNKDLVGDRYSEYLVTDQTPEMDFYAQTRASTFLLYGLKKDE